MAANGMWSEPGTDPREGLAPGRGERAVLAQYLDHYRMTLELKCEGLTAAQLATRSVPPSTMSLLGLVRHLARVEHSGGGGCSRATPTWRASTAPMPTPTSTSTAPCPTTRSSPTRGAPGAPRSSTPVRSTRGLDLDALVEVHGETSRCATSSCTSSRSTPATRPRRPAARVPRRAHRPVALAPVSAASLAGARDRRREVEPVGRAATRRRTPRAGRHRARAAGRRRRRCRGPRASGRRRAGPGPARGHARRRARPSTAPRAPRAPRTAAPRAPGRGRPRSSPAAAAPPPAPARHRRPRRAAGGRGRRGAAAGAARPASSRSRPAVTAGARRSGAGWRAPRAARGRHPRARAARRGSGRRARAGRPTRRPWLVDEPGGVDGGDDPRERVVAHPRRQRDDQVTDPVDVGRTSAGSGATQKPPATASARVVRQRRVVAQPSPRPTPWPAGVGRTARTPSAASVPGQRAVGRLGPLDLVVASASSEASRRSTDHRKSSSPSSAAGMPSPAAQRRSRSVSEPLPAHTRAATTASASPSAPPTRRPLARAARRPQRRPAPGRGRLLLRREEERHDLARDDQGGPGQHRGGGLAWPGGRRTRRARCGGRPRPGSPRRAGRPRARRAPARRARRPGRSAGRPTVVRVERHLGPGEVAGVGHDERARRARHQAGHRVRSPSTTTSTRATSRPSVKAATSRVCGRSAGWAAGGVRVSTPSVEREPVGAGGLEPRRAPRRAASGPTPLHRGEEVGEGGVAEGVAARWSRTPARNASSPMCATSWRSTEAPLA